MRRISLLLLSGLALLNSCDTGTEGPKPCEPVTVTAPASEVFNLQSYISANGISATADSRGFFYVISRPGSDIKPSACSNITASYTLRLSNGTEVEAGNGVKFSLGNLILGWQEGLPLIGEGGSIILYLPPSLGYGAQASTKVPANSILVFHIDLIDVI